MPLTSGTSLLGLGFLTRGNFTVSDGTFTTTYQSTGTDTVGDLISAINSGAPGNALVRAWLNGSGNLVITSQNKNDTVTVGGDYAAALGFGSTNATFAPTKPPPFSHPVVSSSTSATSGSASKSTATPASGISANSALALQTGGTAELLLASSGSPAALSIYWLESRLGAGELRRQIAAKRHRPNVVKLAVEIGPDLAAHVGPALAESKILAQVSAVLGDHAFE